jgi:hypothetical protein
LAAAHDSRGERSGAGAELLTRYNQGKSIRELCGESGYSIGGTRRLLQEAGVEFRKRGDAGDGRVRWTFGERKYARLAQLKLQCDPDNVFRGAINVPPIVNLVPQRERVERVRIG